MGKKKIELDFFEIGSKITVPYQKENKDTSKVVRDIIKKNNYPSNGEVKITRNGVSEIVRYANCNLLRIIRIH